MKFDETLRKMLVADLDSGCIPFLLGEPGIGKSSYVGELAKLFSTKVFVLACNQLADKADLTGGRLVPIDGTNEYKMVFYPHSVIMDAILYAEDHPRENPILFMDELNRTTPDVTSACLSLPTMRKIGDKALPDNLRIICAGNDKGNITSLDEASISRFVLYHVEPDIDTYLGLDADLNPFIRKTLQEHPETILCKKIRKNTGADNAVSDDDYDFDINDVIDTTDMDQIATPRTITMESRALNKLSNDDLMALITEVHMTDGEEVSMLQEFIEAHTGKTAFSAYLLQTIVTDISVTNNQANTVTITRPVAYDTMKACPDMDALSDYISGMSNIEKSACLVYALYEHADNAPFITQLAPQISSLEKDDIKTLMVLISTDQLDESNKDALVNTKSAIANTLSLMLSVN